MYFFLILKDYSFGRFEWMISSFLKSGRPLILAIVKGNSKSSFVQLSMNCIVSFATVFSNHSYDKVDYMEKIYYIHRWKYCPHFFELLNCCFFLLRTKIFLIRQTFYWMRNVFSSSKIFSGQKNKKIAFVSLWVNIFSSCSLFNVKFIINECNIVRECCTVCFTH